MSQERVLGLAVRWLILAASVWLAAEILPGIHLEGWESTLIVALILGLLNLYVRPLLVLLALPATILTLGLFLVVVNAVLLLLADWIANIDDDILFDVEGFFDALLGAVIISLANFVIGRVVRPEGIAGNLSGRW